MCDQQRPRSACAYVQFDQSLFYLLHLEFLSLTGGCTGLSESTPVKMPHCVKSHATAQMVMRYLPSLVCVLHNTCTWYVFCIYLYMVCLHIELHNHAHTPYTYTQNFIHICLRKLLRFIQICLKDYCIFY